MTRPVFPSNEEFELASFEQVSIGFMQTVFELLTEPGDLVLDWAVAGGVSFTAGVFQIGFLLGPRGHQNFIKLQRAPLRPCLTRCLQGLLPGQRKLARDMTPCVAIKRRRMKNVRVLQYMLRGG
jgi:hypothetical protein